MANESANASTSTLLMVLLSMMAGRPPGTEWARSRHLPRFSSIMGPRITPRAIAPVSMPSLPPKKPTKPNTITTHMSIMLLEMA